MAGTPALAVSRIAASIPAASLNAGAIIGFSLVGVVLAVLTAATVNRTGLSPETLVAVVIADLAYIALVLGIIGRRVWLLLSARRRDAAGARLHLRLIGIFAVVALAPTIVIAVFATLTVNQGVNTWFSGQVGSVVRNSLITAQAYADEHRRSIEREVLNMANDMNRAGALGIGDAALADLLRRQQALRRFPEAYLIDGAGQILHRGDFSYTFTYDAPTEVQIAEARLGRVVVLEDQENNELRALVDLTNYIDTFLYVSRQVDGEVLLLLDDTAETVALYNQTEAARGRILSVFALIYVGFSLLVVSTAAWLGLWLAERLARPITALAVAAERVGEGDLDIRVPEEKAGDEVALLSRVFNRMTSQVKEQRDELVHAKEESEERRNFIETVLSGVSAGVVGLDASGRVEMRNEAAARILGEAEQPGGALPEALRGLFATAARAVDGVAQGQVAMETEEGRRELLVRVAARSSADHGLGYVMTLDDLTALVSAQREAAWGDVARRIAHEIKNPLTPIQLSAERLRRKFAPLAGEERAAFEQYADVIIRQAGDIRRMVDEFSRFARMPSPAPKPTDVAALLRDAVLMQRTARPDIAWEIEGADAPQLLACDGGMISQALTNLLKNGAEAIDSQAELDPAFVGSGRILAQLKPEGAGVALIVEDNGIGLPKDRARLTEPYVTTRAKGTGLGLAIVKKIAEQHDGALRLDDARAPADESGRRGARVSLVLPRRENGAGEGGGGA